MREDAVIDRAAQVVREMDVPPGPPADVVRRVRGMDRRWPPVRMAAIAAAVLVMLGLSWVVITLNARVAFAEVQQELKKVQTVRYTELTTQQGLPDTTAVATVDMAGKFARTEIMLNGKVRTISIYNAGRMLNLDPETKTGQLMDYTTGDGLPHQLSESHTLADLLTFDPAKAESLGTKVVDGKKTAGFRLNRDYDKFTKRTVEVWVDVETKLPVRVKERFSMRYPDEAQTKAIAAMAQNGKLNVSAEEQEKMMESWPEVVTTRELTDIQFHVVVDESTFSIKPPERYTVTSTTLPG